MEEDDRYTRITLRIPKDLHQQLSTAAEGSSKSLNAEIIGRLNGSFDAADAEQVKALVKDLEIEKLRTQKERFDGLGAKLIAVQMATIVDPEALARRPSLAKAVNLLRTQERELMLDMLEHTIVGIAQVPKILEQRIKSGNLKVVSADEGPTKFEAVATSLGRTSSALQDVISGLDSDVLAELFARPKVKSFLELPDESTHTDSVAPPTEVTGHTGRRIRRTRQSKP